MGYWANGSGSATFKENANIDGLRDVLRELIDENNYDHIEYEIDESGIDFWENDTHWHEEDTMEFLDALIPYISEGTADYQGEENCHWRYSFDPEKEEWFDISGTIYYGEKDMIKSLEEMGYTVIKKGD